MIQEDTTKLEKEVETLKKKNKKYENGMIEVKKTMEDLKELFKNQGKIVSKIPF